jgi:hypothetical protein
MDPVWNNLLIKFQQGWTWLIYFVKDNPTYGLVVLLFIIFLLWLILKPEINHR